MPHFTRQIQHGQFTYQAKIYIWVYRSDTEKLTVKNAGDDLFSLKPFLKSSREVITNDYVIERLKDYLKYGTPTPDISKSDPYDGLDFIPED